MDDLWRDLRLAVRSLRSVPVVTSVAIFSLALGIGATTAIFSVIDSLLLRTLPVRTPEQLVLFTDDGALTRAWNTPVWEQVRRDHPFEQVAAWSRGRFNLAAAGEALYVNGLWASGSFFDILGITASIGRTFGDAYDHPSGGHEGRVAVISYRFWQDHFGGAPKVIGQSILIDRTPYTIIGVTPPQFFGMEIGRTFDVVVPLETRPGSRSLNLSWLTIIARLQPRQRLAAATGAMQARRPAILEALRAAGATASWEQPYLRHRFRLVSVATGVSALREQYRRPLLAILAVVVFVMLIACANIANLLLARVAARRHELSVMTALGASRFRLARQALVESLLLATAGATSGLLLASCGRGALVSQLGRQPDLQSTTIFINLSTNWHVLAFTIGIAVVSVVLFGLGPAVRASVVAPMPTMRDGLGAGDGRVRWSDGLVVAQLALSVVLVVAAVLFVRTFAGLVTRNLGFDPERVLIVSVSAERAPLAAAERIPTFERVLQAMQMLPGVDGAAASLLTPVSGLSLQNQVSVPGAAPVPSAGAGALVNHVSPEWFRTMDTPLVAGRNFTDADRAGSTPVAIVNQAFVRQFLGDANPLGRAIRGLPVDGPGVTIVGVSGDAVYRSLRSPLLPTIYLPFAQSREVTTFAMASVTVRTAADRPASLAGSITTALESIAPELTWTIRPLSDQIGDAASQERLTATLAGSFGVLALFLAALGLYGVTAYNVSRRRFEMGVRMALGASPATILRSVVGRVLLLVAIGAAAGVAASISLVRFVAALLYGVAPRDPLTLFGASVLLIAVAVAAAALPASRAARIDPATVLRNA
jgi:predicted permease